MSTQQVYVISAYQQQGIHGLGGRMGTRTVDPQPLTFDHAAQFFTVSDPNFAEIVELWSKNDLVHQWHGAVGELESGGRFSTLPPSPSRYIGADGMRPLAESILSEVLILPGSHYPFLPIRLPKHLLCYLKY